MRPAKFGIGWMTRESKSLSDTAMDTQDMLGEEQGVVSWWYVGLHQRMDEDRVQQHTVFGVNGQDSLRG